MTLFRTFSITQAQPREVPCTLSSSDCVEQRPAERDPPCDPASEGESEAQIQQSHPDHTQIPRNLIFFLTFLNILVDLVKKKQALSGRARLCDSVIIVGIIWSTPDSTCVHRTGVRKQRCSPAARDEYSRLTPNLVVPGCRPDGGGRAGCSGSSSDTAETSLFR